MALVIRIDAGTVAGLADRLVRRDPVAYTVFGSISEAVSDSTGAAPWAAHPAGVPEVLAARSQAHTPVAFGAGWTGVAELAEAVRAVREARRPLIVAGGGVHHSRAEAVLAEFASATGIPLNAT